jgi:hypothetical protein
VTDEEALFNKRVHLILSSLDGMEITEILPVVGCALTVILKNLGFNHITAAGSLLSTVACILESLGADSVTVVNENDGHGPTLN